MGFFGKSITLQTSVNNLIPYYFNDRASSVRVHEGTWELYRQVDYQGIKIEVIPGEYDFEYLVKTVGNDTISSVKILDGLTLYTRRNWTGKSLTLNDSQPNLGGFITTSLIIHNGTWILYELPDFSGNSYKVTPGKYDADLLMDKLGSISSLQKLEKLHH